MKKWMNILTAGLLSLTLAACNQNNSVSGSDADVEYVVDRCLNMLENAEISEAMALTTGNATNSLASLTESLNKMSDVFTVFDANESLSTRAEDFSKRLYGLFFDSHTIDSISRIDDETYKVTTSLTLYDAQMIKDAFDTEAQTQDYDYSEEGYEGDGTDNIAETADTQFSAMLDQFDEILTQLSESPSYVQQATTLTVVKTDGKWLISEFSESE